MKIIFPVIGSADFFFFHLREAITTELELNERIILFWNLSGILKFCTKIKRMENLFITFLKKQKTKNKKIKKQKDKYFDIMKI